MEPKSASPTTFSKVDMTTPSMKEYRIHGSAMPTDDNPRPQVFVATVFAKNHVLAKSRFFKILEKKHKIKASRGLVISWEAVPEPAFKEVKNYGIKFVYHSRNGTHNSYKECRAVSRCSAIEYVLREVAGRHRLKGSAVDVISVDVVPDDELRRAKTMEFARDDVEFPVFTKIVNTRRQLIAAESNPSD